MINNTNLQKRTARKQAHAPRYENTTAGETTGCKQTGATCVAPRATNKRAPLRKSARQHGGTQQPYTREAAETATATHTLNTLEDARETDALATSTLTTARPHPTVSTIYPPTP